MAEPALDKDSPTQRSHADLVSCPEDGWLLGAPVIGVLVLVALLLHQGASLLQSLYDRLVPFLLHLRARKSCREEDSSKRGGFMGALRMHACSECRSRKGAFSGGW